MSPGTSPRENSSGASTSHTLLQKVRGQDPGAWQRLVTIYSPLVRYWCRRMYLPDQEVADVEQEVFQAVARGIQRFRKRDDGGSFRGWLRTVTRSKVLDYYRRSGKQPAAAGGTDANLRMHRLADPLTIEDPETDDPVVVNQVLRRALAVIQAEFEPRTWRAFWRVVVDGRAPDEAGQELEMSPGAVRVAKSRVLQRLRRELGEQPD